MSAGLPLVFIETSPEPKRSTVLPFSDDTSDPKKFTPRLPNLVARVGGPESFPNAEPMGLRRTVSPQPLKSVRSPTRAASSSNTGAWGGLPLRIDRKAVHEFLAPILTKKTAFVMGWVVVTGIWNSTVQAAVDHWTFFNEYHVVDTSFSNPANRRALPDLGFHLLPYIATPHIADHWNAIMIVPTFLIMFPALGNFRARVLQRFCLIQGLCFLVRSFSILMTFLPNPYESCALNPARDESFVMEGLKVMRGERFTCGDVMYSGHSVNMTLMNLVWQQYLPKEWTMTPYLRAFWWILNIGGLLCCVSTHFHYSVDCYLGFIVACSFWAIYHLALKVPRSQDGKEGRLLGWLSPVGVFLWIEDDLDENGLLLSEYSKDVVCGRSLEGGCVPDKEDEKADVDVELATLLGDTWERRSD